jgi:hypothetical protein
LAKAFTLHPPNQKITAVREGAMFKAINPATQEKIAASRSYFGQCDRRPLRRLLLGEARLVA